MAKEFKGVPVFGKKVADARNQLVLAQEELAPKLKMTKNNLSRIEREEVTGMNRESFRLFAELLGISVEEMLKKVGANHFATDPTPPRDGSYVKHPPNRPAESQPSADDAFQIYVKLTGAERAKFNEMAAKLASKRKGDDPKHGGK